MLRNVGDLKVFPIPSMLRAPPREVRVGSLFPCQTVNCNECPTTYNYWGFPAANKTHSAFREVTKASELLI